MTDNLFGGRILVVAPHYDDEIIGCGGTLLRFRMQIERLVFFHFTHAPQNRLEEFREICEIINPDKCYALDCEDGFCGESRRMAVLALINAIQVEQPDIVLAPHSNEAHSDHQDAFCITLNALQKARFWDMPPPAMPHRVPFLLEYEVWTAISTPSWACDISSVFSDKCRLISTYASQIKSFPYVEYVRALNAWRGLLFFRGGQAEVFSIRAI